VSEPVAGQAAGDDPLTVYLVTAAPGDAIWERFGHNGIWIHDERSGDDIFWEWGLFSFTQEGFIPRLARGTMLYSMGGRYLEDMLAIYGSQDRPVWAQELALTPEQERTLDRFIRNNARPENRDYVYDYYTDNCSTRARDALDVALGGQLRAAFEGVSTGTTWRWHSRRLLRPDPLAEAGLQVVLGNPGDEAITAWQEMFLPMSLRAHLAEARIQGPDGVEIPLVVRETQLLSSTRPPPPEAPGRRLIPALLLGLLLAGVIVTLPLVGAGGGGGGQRLFGAAAAGWSLLAGILGWVLLVAWIFTDHDFWRWNENLLQLNPASLVAGVLALPLLAGRRPSPKLVPFLRGVALLSAGALLLKLLPWFGQGNWEVVAVALPVNAALALAASRLEGRSR